MFLEHRRWGIWQNLVHCKCQPLIGGEKSVFLCKKGTHDGPPIHQQPGRVCSLDFTESFPTGCFKHSKYWLLHITVLENEGNGWRRQIFFLDKSVGRIPMAAQGSMQSLQGLSYVLWAGATQACWLPGTLHVYPCRTWGECFLLCSPLTASFLSLFQCGNETGSSWFCAACLGAGDTTSIWILLAGLRSSLSILKFWWLSSKNHLNLVLPSKENWKIQSCYAWSLSYSNSFIQSLFASVSGDLLDNHVFMYYAGHLLTQNIAVYYFPYPHETPKVFCSKCNLVYKLGVLSIFL